MASLPSTEAGHESVAELPVRKTTAVAVDLLGADLGWEVTLKGALLALERDASLRLQLVGPAEHVEPALERLDSDPASRIRLVNAAGEVPGDMPASRALRQCGASSLAVAIRRVREGSSDAVVSAGNTGALMAFSRHLLGMLPGIERPALMARLPARDGAVWMLDLGANIGVDARRLFEFAMLGSAAVSAIENAGTPRVGLLNVGEETNKGSDVVQEAGRLIAESDLDYAGFVEAHHVFAGKVDVVVCDGFVGNVLLKGSEGLAQLLMARLTETLSGGLRARLGASLVRSSLQSLVESLDPDRHNGASLLGVGGIVIKSHGGASARAFASAVELAARESRRGVIGAIERQLWASY